MTQPTVINAYVYMPTEYYYIMLLSQPQLMLTEIA